MQVEVWTAADFSKEPPEGCGLSPEQYRDFIDFTGLAVLLPALGQLETFCQLLTGSSAS